MEREIMENIKRIAAQLLESVSAQELLLAIWK
jgi:hypothetical protein